MSSGVCRPNRRISSSHNWAKTHKDSCALPRSITYELFTPRLGMLPVDRR